MRIRTFALLAVLAAFAASFIFPATNTQAQDLLKCYHLIVPVSDFGIAQAGLYDYEDDASVFNNFTWNETNSTIDYYIAVSPTQVAYVASWPNVSQIFGDDAPFLPGGSFKLGEATLEEVDWAFCNGSIMDGRLNSSDLGALSYIYPATDGYSVWELNLGDMNGYEQFTATQADIAAAVVLANETGVNQMIGTSERGTTLWALVGGMCQMNHFELDGKINEFAFACA